ncbi:glycosyltransferase [uncultured Cellulomonas sp.]|uniref:glycosyltransferase n=1 Tax=uncultured Cellulomonas sp. TaxID=189682 RepID=UPI0026223393|nr:glycosyltransferase [uncultured Cellulomonas sp.]
MPHTPSPARRRGGRPDVVHVTWQRHGGRAEEISHALGGRALHVHPGGMTRRHLVPLRYLVSLGLTVGGLVRLRPRSVIVTNPPVFPGVAVAAYCAVTRRPFVLDSHPGSFGVKRNAVARRLLGVTRWLARRAAGVMVTVDVYAERVRSWGGHGLVVHEAPPLWRLPAVEPVDRPRVLCVGVFSVDEPIEEVVRAAALLPDVDIAITGDLAKCPPALRDAAGPNVEFVGFLGPDAYAREFARADAVITLTTEPTSIMRSAYEAVYARRPLVTSDWPALRAVFAYGHFAANEGPALAAAVREALGDGPEVLEAALTEQQQRWDAQLADLRTALRLG